MSIFQKWNMWKTFFAREVGKSGNFWKKVNTFGQEIEFHGT